jgi:hypothetical protein
MTYDLRLRCRSQQNRNLDTRFLFEQVFSEKWSLELLGRIGYEWRERVFSPLVTIWVFTNQILNQDHSCRAAVASLKALRSYLKLPRISLNSSAYCRARARLSLNLVQEWALGAGSRLIERTDGLWKGLEVLLIDGSHLKMPDTVKNRNTYGATVKGSGLVTARILGVFSLSCGCLREFMIGPWVGKGSGEVSMLRALLKRLKKGQLVIMDRLFGNYVDMALIELHELVFVVRMHGRLKNYLTKKKIGKNEWLIELGRPARGKIKSVGIQFLDLLPETITIRLVVVRLAEKGFRPKQVYLLTSLFDRKKYSAEEIAQLYAWRWNVEVDFRSLKSQLGLDVLRCKTPGMVEKEAWMHVLVYNMVRVVMAEASLNQKLSVRQVSFTECTQLLERFRILCSLSEGKTWKQLYTDILDSIKTKVGNRPGRREPRALKYDPRKYSLLNMPRAKARKGFWKKGWAYEKRKAEKRVA